MRVAFVHDHDPWHSNFYPRAHKCIFVGLPHNQNSYKCFNQTSKNYLGSMDITFFEVTPFYTDSHLQGEHYHQDWSKSEFSIELYVPYTTDFSHRTLGTIF